MKLAPGIVLLTGDARARLRDLPAGKVQTCVTSPPYWGLRDYGHDGQLGGESSPSEYVSNLVAVFQEVRRVLADDGTLWLNLGDSYARNPAKGGSGPGGKHRDWLGNSYSQAQARRPGVSAELPEKNLIGIPWRVALALQADGWWLRQDIIWHKPNPIPAPVTDRCVSAHEYMFLLTKAPRYYFNHEAIREPAVGQPGERNKRSVWTVPPASYKGAHFATFPPALVDPCIRAGSRPGDVVLDPFNGAGTTGIVARDLGRKYLGIELNPEYVNLTRRRFEVEQ